MANIVRTTCSGCTEPVRVNLHRGTATMRVPSNGKRGSLHVPAHDAVADVIIDADGDLAMWDCPVCGYADSVYADPEVRADLA